MTIAKEELKVKQTLIEELTESNGEVNKFFEQISQFITSSGKAIINGMALMTAAIGSWQQRGINL